MVGPCTMMGSNVKMEAYVVKVIDANQIVCFVAETPCEDRDVQANNERGSTPLDHIANMRNTQDEYRLCGISFCFSYSATMPLC